MFIGVYVPQVRRFSRLLRIFFDDGGFWRHWPGLITPVYPDVDRGRDFKLTLRRADTVKNHATLAFRKPADVKGIDWFNFIRQWWRRVAEEWLEQIRTAWYATGIRQLLHLLLIIVRERKLNFISIPAAVEKRILDFEITVAYHG